MAAPTDEHGQPAHAPTGVGTTPPAMGCGAEAGEPDSMTSPRLLSAGRQTGLCVSAGDEDFWEIRVEPGMLARMRIEFNHSAGDVDMTLHRRSDGVQIDISEGVTHFEELVYTGETSESLVLRVYGYGGITNAYSISLAVDDFSVTCVGDSAEPNNAAAPATLTAPRGDARLCLSDEDWYSVDVLAGEGFDFGIDFDGEMADLEVAIHALPHAPALRVARSHNNSAVVVLDRAESAGRYLVRVHAPAGGFNRYTWSLARYAAGSGEAGTVAGRVEYEDQLRGRDVVIGAPWNRWLPARSVPVELVRASDNRVIATTYTDDSGAYVLPYAHRAGGEAYVRVSARLEAPGYEMRIVDNEQTRVVQTGRSAALHTLTLDAAGNRMADFRFEAAGPLGGAFNVTDRSLDAFRFIERHQAPTGLDLTIVWQRGRPHECTSCYDDGVIYLGGGFDDPDEYDDSVILHEFGHFFIDRMSHDDSPGGHHNGDRTDPLVAYGEGIATLFSMMVEDSWVYVDTMTSGGMVQDFELAPFEEARGTSTGSLTGQVSEYLVVALLWDVLDGSAEGHDGLAAGAEAIMRVLFDYMPTSQTRNQGVPGADLADFVEGLRTLHPQHVAGLDQLLTHYRFPGGSLLTSRPGPAGVK